MITRETWGKVHELLRNLPDKRLALFDLYDLTQACPCAFGAVSGLPPTTLRNRDAGYEAASTALATRLGIPNDEAQAVACELMELNDDAEWVDDEDGGKNCLLDATAADRYVRVLKAVAKLAKEP